MSSREPPSHYSDYLQLDQLLSCQKLESADRGAPAHDEMLFIIVHQVYELWFKEIVHELDSLISIFSANYVDERSLGLALSRVNRVIEIEKLLIDQVRVIETLTPLDFLDFRNYLGTKSGFQSVQFRLIENKLGLRSEERVNYNEQSYKEDHRKGDKDTLAKSEVAPSLLSVVDAWLARTPFLEFSGFSFLADYERAVQKMLSDERSTISDDKEISQHEREVRLKRINADAANFDQLLNAETYEKLKRERIRRLSYKACQAALFINLYRDEPILHLPFRFLSLLLDMDEHLSLWRYHHALMVLRMIGTRVGTGGSSGHEYLMSTVVKHRVFTDLFALNTLMLPRSYLPTLPETLQRNMDFFFRGQSTSAEK